MQSIRVLERPAGSNGEAVRLGPSFRVPTPLGQPEPPRKSGCRGCGGRREAEGTGEATPGPLDGHWQELNGRFSMLEWLERGLSRLRQEVDAGSAWGRFMLRQAVEGTLEAVEETMLQCDDLRGYALRGGVTEPNKPSGVACALSRAYNDLEQRLRLHMGMERELAEPLEGEVP